MLSPCSKSEPIRKALSKPETYSSKWIRAGLKKTALSASAHHGRELPGDNPAARTWASTGSMNVGRTLARAVLLSNGSVLVVGGCLNDCLSATTRSAELYNPTAGTFTATGSMVQARAEFGVTL